VRSRFSQLDFNYTPPPGFDTRKVKGLVASLLALNSEDHDKSSALEISAGGKLYNVTVEDECVSKDLLERGGFKKRVTLIPLNKICAFKLQALRRGVPYPPHFSRVTYYRCPTPQKLQSAKYLAPGKVRPMLSLVGYPDEVAEAIAFVFSDTSICDDAASAQAVRFSREVCVHSVTPEGHVYKPSGSISGGAVATCNGAGCPSTCRPDP
jgi:structural maintenance of chromosome 2